MATRVRESRVAIDVDPSSSDSEPPSPVRKPRNHAETVVQSIRLANDFYSERHRDRYVDKAAARMGHTTCQFVYKIACPKKGKKKHDLCGEPIGDETNGVYCANHFKQVKQARARKVEISSSKMVRFIRIFLFFALTNFRFSETKAALRRIPGIH